MALNGLLCADVPLTTYTLTLAVFGPAATTARGVQTVLSLTCAKFLGTKILPSLATEAW